MVFEASSVEKLVVVVVVLSSNSTIYFLSDDSNTLYFGHFSKSCVLSQTTQDLSSQTSVGKSA